MTKASIVKNNQKENKKLFKCSVCGFHYEDIKWARKCEIWCRKHHTCNIEITMHAVENK